MARETAERYYIVPLKKRGGMARETAERYYFVP
jgi:hypothetical protein